MAAAAAVEIFKLAARSAAFSAPLVQAGGRRWACPDFYRCVWDPDSPVDVDVDDGEALDVQHLGGIVTVDRDLDRLGASGRMFPAARIGVAAESALSLTFVGGGGPTLAGRLRQAAPLATAILRLYGCEVDQTPAQGSRLLVVMREGRLNQVAVATPARGALDGVTDSADDQLTLRVEPGGLAYARQTRI